MPLTEAPTPVHGSIAKAVTRSAVLGSSGAAGNVGSRFIQPSSAPVTVASHVPSGPTIVTVVGRGEMSRMRCS